MYWIKNKNNWIKIMKVKILFIYALGTYGNKYKNYRRFKKVC